MCNFNKTVHLQLQLKHNVLITGLPASLYNTDLNSPADQYNIKGGGNPNVAPEESESTTIGVVLTPDSVPGLSVTL